MRNGRAGLAWCARNLDILSVCGREAQPKYGEEMLDAVAADRRLALAKTTRKTGKWNVNYGARSAYYTFM